MSTEYHFTLSTPFKPNVKPKEHISTPAFWFLFRGDSILVHSNANEQPTICVLSPTELGMPTLFKRYFGRYGATDCFVAELPDNIAPPPAMEFWGLRSLFGLLGEDIFILAGRAIQILHWHKEHRYCGKCATAMVDQTSELARKCPRCDFISYPRVSPAVIMSVVRGDRILLARSPHFPGGMYSTPAGFVEPGETLEEAVSREVLEEVNISVSNIQYVASQSWPFPHSLMIGFSATYAGGEISIDNDEIEAAGWFSIDRLPELPSKISIARLLIDNFIRNHNCSLPPEHSEP